MADSPLTPQQETKAAAIWTKVQAAQTVVNGHRRQARRNNVAEWLTFNVDLAADLPAGMIVWCDEYFGPAGIGYEVWLQVTKNGTTSRRSWHSGPETYRNAHATWQIVTVP